MITPLKNLFPPLPSKAGCYQIALVSHVKGVSQKDAAALTLGVETKGTVQSTSTVQVLYKTIFPRAITWSTTTSRSRPWDCLPLKRWGLGMRRRA